MNSALGPPAANPPQRAKPNWVARIGGGAGGQVGGAGGLCLIEGVAGMAVWAEVLVLGASACAGDLAAKARRCGLAIARWRSCCGGLTSVAWRAPYDRRPQLEGGALPR